MRIAVTGSSGMIGNALVDFCTAKGHEVLRLRRASAGGPLTWDPAAGVIDTDSLRGVDAVVHLAGEPIAAGRWTTAQKRRILDSRTKGTGLIATTLASMQDGPRVLVTPSGIGYYGDRGDEVLTEDSAPGTDFLARVCQAWEEATLPAEQAGVRVVRVRTGIVQSTADGALARQLPLFRLGLGGRMGSGRQHMSWITLDDTVGVYHHALTTPTLSGPVNATAPNPVTNAEYTRTLGSVLRRPALLYVPRIALRAWFGEMAESLVYFSQLVVPERTVAAGYEFRHPDLEPALRHVLGKA